MRYTQQQKEEHVRSIRKWMANWQAKFDRHIPAEAACLYWSGVVLSYFDSIGETALLQAGSASWARVSQEADDGKMNTHFSYMFEYNAKIPIALSMGVLPEMHVWVAIIDPQQLVDLTTCFVPQQYKKLVKEEWGDKQVPGFIWAERQELEDNWEIIYTPDMRAINIAIQLLRKTAPELPFATGNRR